MNSLSGTAERALAAIAAGEMVIVVDAADRENEGDLVMAAQDVSARHVHFKALPALDNAARRQRALLHPVLTPGRRRPRKVRL